MSLYNYVAVDKRGIRRSGTVDSRSEKAAAALLKKQDLFVVSLKAKNTSVFESFLDFQTIPFSEIVSFTRQLSTMISAGLPIAKALDVLTSQTTNAKFRGMLSDILRDIEGGVSLVVAFGRYPRTFSTTYQALVQAGEASGKLDGILSALANAMEAQRELNAKFKAAMIYPSLVFAAMIGVMILLMTFVVPQLARMYESLNVDLPQMTRVMIQISRVFTDYTVFLFIGLVFIAIVIRSFLKTEYGHQFKSYMLFRLPVFGPLNKKRELTDFTRTLGLLVSSAVPIVTSLEIVSKVVVSPALRAGALKASASIEKGGSLSAYLKSDPAFPPLLGNMVATGEATGKLDDVLTRVSEFYSNETRHAVEGLSAALEPIILILLGVMVGFLIVSIITPIYQITTSI